MRPTKDEYYLKIAAVTSERSTCLKRRYGCVIVKNDEIIATGYNGAPRNQPNCCDIYEQCPRLHVPSNSGDYRGCPAVHAEQNALLSAGRDQLLGATLYLAGFENKNGCWEPILAEPCPICQVLIANAGIANIINSTH